MKIGCHAVLYKERIKSETSDVLAQLGNTGFDGVEIGSRFFGVDEKERLSTVLADNGLVLSGMHVGVGYDEWLDIPDEATERVVSVARFVADLPYKNVIMSGRRSERPVDPKAVARAIDRAAIACREAGAILHYHNHWWEFDREVPMMDALLSETSELLFAVDLGWVYAAGEDPLAFATRNIDRIRYVHLRDMRPGSDEAVDLGGGAIDLRALVLLLNSRLGDDDWTVVEYETGEQDASRYTKARKLISRFGV